MYRYLIVFLMGACLGLPLSYAQQGESPHKEITLDSGQSITITASSVSDSDSQLSDLADWVADLDRRVSVLEGAPPVSEEPEAPETGKPSIEHLQSLSKKWKDTADDPPTAKALKEAWAEVRTSSDDAADITDLSNRYRMAWEKTMREREGLSRYVDWESVYRKPMNSILDESIQKKWVKSTSDLLWFMKAMEAGL